MDEPIFKGKRTKVIVISLILVTTFLGGGLYVNLLSTQPQSSLLEDTSNKLQPIIDKYSWIGVGLSQLNMETEDVIIVVVGSYGKSGDGSLSIQAGDGLNTMTDIVQEEVNAYCQRLGSKYRFDFVPFPVLNTEEGVNASIYAFNELGVKMVVQDYWTVMWQDVLKTIRDNDMLYIIGRDTSRITDKLDGIYGIRPEINKGEYYYAITAAKDVKALVVLQWDFSPLSSVQRRSMEQQYAQALEDYEALGGVVYKKIIYPPAEAINCFRDIENNADFSQILVQAETAVNEALTIYGEGGVGVLVIGDEMSPFIYQSRNMSSLMSIPWFGDTLAYGCPIRVGSPVSEQFGPYVERAGFYLPVESVEDQEALQSLRAKLADELGTDSYDFAPQETSRYDGCWLLALSVIKADSTDPKKVEAALPLVSAEYNGLNGNYAMDEKGDKISYTVDIYKVYEYETGKYAHFKCCSFNTVTGMILNDTNQPIP
ncbi:MAG TPA: hypothetical protein VMW03_08220 [Candidatus Krumholzibacteriaceae bacterium]|nr:hypothetical protein [Candidatus Krumholzibacteriaceae bacterium]